jgi:hypothetical protein
VAGVLRLTEFGNIHNTVMSADQKITPETFLYCKFKTAMS